MFQNQRYQWSKNFTNGDTYSGEAIADNIKDGQGTYYWAATAATYTGAWSKDQPHGQGTLTVPGVGGYTYLGSFACGKRCGHGECRFSNGRVYVGEWVEDLMHGQGALRGGTEDSFEEYKGPFAKGLRNGKRGQCTYANGDRYVGDWLDDKRHGMGDLTLAPEAREKKLLTKLVSSRRSSLLQSSNAGFNLYLRPPPSTTVAANVVRYKGPFERDMPSCVAGGELMYDDGSTYVGAVDEQLRRSGKGQHRMPNGDVYAGHFSGDERDGRGVLRCAVDEVSYDGTWRHDELDGLVTYHRAFSAPPSEPISTTSGEGIASQLSLSPLSIVDYEGPCVRGEFTGSKAVITFSDRSTYRGDVHDGQPSGRGVLESRLVRGCFPPAAFGPEVVLLQYEGSFSKGEPDGDGTATLRTASSDSHPGSVGGSSATAVQGVDPASLALVRPEAEGLRLWFDRSGTFQGRWSRGLPEGPGEWHWEGDEREMYRGEVHLGLPNGQGLYESSSEHYEGRFEKGLPSGYGVYRNILTHVTFQGSWLAGLYHGLGDWSLSLGKVGGSGASASLEITYKGSWQNGKKHGYGVEHNTGDIYEGEFVDGMRHGHGVLRHLPDDGYCYEGIFTQGALTGTSGKLTLPKGTVVTGSFENGVPHGENICAVFPQGLTFKGRYDHGCPTGVGDITYTNGDHYYGEVERVTPASGPQDWAPQRHGKGTYTFSEGNRLECTWQHNILNGYGKHISPNGEVSERHYADGVVLSKATSSANVFTLENEFPNTQSERLLKSKLEAINHPHRFIRRGEARQAVKSAVSAVAGSGTVATKESGVADTVPQHNSPPAPAKKEVPDGAPLKGQRRQRSSAAAPTPAPARPSTSRSDNLTGPSSGVMGKRVMAVENPLPPCSVPVKATSVSVSVLSKGSEKAPDIGAKSGPTRIPKRSAHHVATPKTGKGTSNHSLANSCEATSQERPSPSLSPQRLSSGTSANYSSKRAASLSSFHKIIKRLNINNEDSPDEKDGNAINQGTYGSSSASEIRPDCSSSRGTVANSVTKKTSQPHLNTTPDTLFDSSLGMLMREACEIRSSTEDEVYTLTEKVRTLNEKIWQLRFFLSSKPATVAPTRNGTAKLKTERSTNGTRWEPLDALQRERREVVETLLLKLEQSEKDS